MSKYRKKPVIINAVKFTGAIEEIQELLNLGMDTISISYKDQKNPTLSIKTLEGTMTAQVGDYIIKGVQGEFYPCKPDIFEQTYELIEGEE